MSFFIERALFPEICSKGCWVFLSLTSLRSQTRSDKLLIEDQRKRERGGKRGKRENGGSARHPREKSRKTQRNCRRMSAIGPLPLKHFLVSSPTIRLHSIPAPVASLCVPVPHFHQAPPLFPPSFFPLLFSLSYSLFSCSVFSFLPTSTETLLPSLWTRRMLQRGGR